MPTKKDITEEQTKYIVESATRIMSMYNTWDMLSLTKGEELRSAESLQQREKIVYNKLCTADGRQELISACLAALNVEDPSSWIKTVHIRNTARIIGYLDTPAEKVSEQLSAHAKGFIITPDDQNIFELQANKHILEQLTDPNNTTRNTVISYHSLELFGEDRIISDLKKLGYAARLRTSMPCIPETVTEHDTINGHPTWVSKPIAPIVIISLQ